MFPASSLKLRKLHWKYSICKKKTFEVLRHENPPFLFFKIVLRTVIIAFALNQACVAQPVRKIELLNADIIDYDEYKLGKEIRRLKGNVSMKHDNAILRCDSAYFNSTKNNISMFSNVHINFGDTINLYGDSIKYFGNIRTAYVRNNVKLTNKNVVLTTDSLNYDRNLNLGYYFNYGTIKDGDNSLVSEWGYYYALLKDFVAVKHVILTNPDYRMFSDSLRYNTESEISSFYGPSRIVGDSMLIYCENGWYNTKTEISQFNKNAFLKSKSTVIKGDSLFYNRNKGIGKAFLNVSITDTSENVTLSGNYGFYNEAPEMALITDSAVLINYSDTDTLFLHADTIKTVTFTDSAVTFKNIFAYHNVRIFKEDYQGVCDSLTYSTADSVFRFFVVPVLWSGEHQLTAEVIEIYTKNSKADYIELRNAAFIVSKEDTVSFNQIKGKNMTGFIAAGELYKVLVDGNGQTLYYPKENEEYIGINKAESSNMNIYLVDGEVNKILFITKPNATLYPPEDLPVQERFLPNFRWFEDLRPLNKQDIFR